MPMFQQLRFPTHIYNCFARAPWKAVSIVRFCTCHLVIINVNRIAGKEDRMHQNIRYGIGRIIVVKINQVKCPTVIYANDLISIGLTYNSYWGGYISLFFYLLELIIWTISSQQTIHLCFIVCIELLVIVLVSLFFTDCLSIDSCNLEAN